jgi:DNA-binding transcriptional ArsR family regulator
VSARRVVDDVRIAKALSHPLRTRILTILAQRLASPRQLADELEEPLHTVSYHVRALRRLKLIRMVDVKRRRGSIEHYYQAVADLHRVTDDAWAKLPTIAKQAVVSSALNEIATEVGAAAEFGGFEHDDSHLGRMNVLLDEQGFHELSKELHRLYDRAQQIETDSTARLAASDDADEWTSSLVTLLYTKPTQPAGSGPVPERTLQMTASRLEDPERHGRRTLQR